MNKKLLTQIKNEWRSNLWLVTELLLVSVVMWYIVDYMYVKAAVYYEPRGFDISHCYLIQMGRLTDKSPDFIPNQTKEQQREDVKGLAERLKYRPDIYNPQIQISAESETKRSIFREKDKTKRSKKESAQHSKSRNKSFVMTSVSAL